MSGLIALTVFVVMALAGEVLGRHDASFKSFGATSNECSRYLNNDGNGDCNIRCVGTIAHVWNDTLAKFSRNYADYFVPDPQDTCFENRTERCLRQVENAVPVYDKCTRANKFGQCFVDQYGQLNSNRPQYVPMTDLQYTRVFLQCAAMLRLSNNDLNAMAQQDAYNVPAAACLLRCTLIRMGLYSDDKGIDVSLATRQCGLYNATSNIDQCQAKIQAEECDKCTRTIRIAKECLNMHFNVKKLGDTYGLELYGVCASYCAYYFYYECFYYACPYMSFQTSSFTSSSSTAGTSTSLITAGK